MNSNGSALTMKIQLCSRNIKKKGEIMMIKFTTVTNANGNKSVKFVLLDDACG